MRLFVGVELSDGVRGRAADAATHLRREAERTIPKTVLRWVDSANLHITVWFLGEVRDPRDQTVVAALEEPLRVRPFTMHVKGAGAFPRSGPPRAIWLGLEAGREGLLAIHDALRQRVAPLGFEPEKRPYAPHLTIARVKDVRPRDSSTLRRMVDKALDDAGACKIRHATLFRSRTLPTGSHYEALVRTPLLE